MNLISARDDHNLSFRNSDQRGRISARGRPVDSSARAISRSRFVARVRDLTSRLPRVESYRLLAVARAISVPFAYLGTIIDRAPAYLHYSALRSIAVLKFSTRRCSEKRRAAENNRNDLDTKNFSRSLNDRPNACQEKYFILSSSTFLRADSRTLR